MKGLIALDIDGTITADHNDLAPDVATFLEKLSLDGWLLMFITGRPFLWGYEVLQHLHFPYYFAVQNGAIILQMPSKKTVLKKYLDQSVLPAMDLICADEDSDYVIYTGFENDDICYYRPQKFAPELLKYVQNRFTVLKEKWIPLDSYDKLPVKEFASVKCFGNEKSAKRICDKIEKMIGLHAPLNKDPFDRTPMYVVQATHQEVSKGYALLDMKKLLNYQGVTIAAGDDNNDRSMLKVADIRVVMSTAPKDMLETAHVIAPPATEKGIIKGLQQAITLASIAGERK